MRGESFGDVAARVGAGDGSARMSAAPGHGMDVVVATGVQVQRCWAWLISIDQL